MKPTLNEQLARMQKLAGIISENQTNEGYDEFQRADKGSKDVTAKDKEEEEVYGAGVEKGEEIEKKKMTKEQLKAQIKEMILAELTEDSTEDIEEPGALNNMYDPLAEAKKDEEVEDITVDDTEVVDAPASDMMAGESAEISGIQSNLQAAYAEAKALGDEKLITQIANTITYFTKAHILDTAPINEQISPEAIDRMEGLANIRLLKILHDSLRILGTEWMTEGFEKEDVKEYISNFIDNI
jgi:hypothetical protein